MDNGSLFVLMLIGGGLSAMIAAGKGRNAVGWLFVGAVFPLIALIAILCLPAVAAAPAESAEPAKT